MSLINIKNYTDHATYLHNIAAPRGAKIPSSDMATCLATCGCGTGMHCLVAAYSVALEACIFLVLHTRAVYQQRDPGSWTYDMSWFLLLESDVGLLYVRGEDDQIYGLRG
ncbi:hypothetical protein B0T17DRAFT_506105 [Bombardia bombarda]|uniref:Uncharacterized protein n=1 Tax=Bombardia bombarda TaxID=252184 RepID=A0AA39XA87_9PEZI|nr:hypothetical protein B0T17DRAFT_506105 [Bombardia bombarda]